MSELMRKALAQISSFDPVLALAEDHLFRFLIAGGNAALPPGSSGTRAGGVSVIPVHGALVPRGGRGFYSAVTGMDALRGQIRAAANDSDVSAIVLDVDSPGGTVAGTDETAAEIAAAAKKKPVVAVANTLMASAAYWLGSQASQVVMTPGADVGSIGAMAMHIDVSKALDELGVKVTMIRSAPYKNEAAPFAPLSDEARAHYQARVDEAGADFINAVANGRRTTQKAVRENFGQGRVYGAREALSRGMVDRIGSFESVMAGLRAGSRPGSPHAGRYRHSALLFG